jgi:hypothetical protein
MNLNIFDLFSFALMILFAFHAKNTAFSKCFPKKGKEQNYSFAPPPPFPAFGSGVYAPLPLAPTPWKRWKMFKFIYINSI